MMKMAWDKKIEISGAVSVVLYELFHCAVVPEYITIVCDFYSCANWYGCTNEGREVKEVSRGLHKVWIYFSSN
jgi:hypothetical protein